jgi:hypothetical protein
MSVSAQYLAAPESELGCIEMQDMIANGIEQIAVVADDKDRRRVAFKIIDQPKRAFEIEIIGRLFEKHQIRARKQNRGESDAHPPAAGKFVKRPLLRRFTEAKASQNARCPCGRRMRRNIDEARLNLADARRIGRRLGFGHQTRAFEIGGKDKIDQALRPARRLLLDTAETRCPRERYRTRVRRELAR